MADYKVNPTDLPGQVYDTLKQMILRSQLLPGQKLGQEELAAKLGVSRTPLLSAFYKLERELLVENLPRRGYFVKEISPKEELDIFDIRIKLEPLGAHQAALNADSHSRKKLNELLERGRSLKINDQYNQQEFKEYDHSFHSLIMQLSSNDYLYNIITSFNIIILSNQLVNFQKADHSLDEHEQVIEAVLNARADEAEQLMFNHLKSGRDRVIKRMETES